MTTTTLISTLAALSTDLVTVAATERDGRLVVSYVVAGDDLTAAEVIGAQVSREIGDAMRAAGYRFVDAGGDAPGIYEVWASEATATTAEAAPYTVCARYIGSNVTEEHPTQEAAIASAKVHEAHFERPDVSVRRGVHWIRRSWL